MNVFDIHKEQLSKYCASNGYSIEKMKALPRCGNNTCLYIQALNSAKTGMGLTDENPAEIVLAVVVDKNGKYTFEKGKNADKLLKA